MSSSMLSGITSLINYAQNLALTLDQSSMTIPPKLKNVFLFFTHFLSYILAILPKVPDFDNRVMLVMLCVGVPLLLNIFFVWFSMKILETIFHIIDIAAAFFFAFSVVRMAYTSDYLVLIAVIVVVIIYACFRFYFYYSKERKNAEKINYISFVRSVCNFYMNKIDTTIPSEETLETVIKDYQHLVEVLPVNPNPFVTAIYFIIFVILMFFGLWAVKAFTIPLKPSPDVSAFLPIFAFPIAIICFIIFCMRLTKQGYDVIFSISKFFKKWGLRIAMFLIELLYVPMLMPLVKLLTPIQYGCPVGTYMDFTVDMSATEAPYVVRKFNCSLCTVACGAACDGSQQLRNAAELGLLYVDDVLKVSGGTIVFAFLFILIGIPVIWLIVILKNRELAFEVNAYGETVNDKWMILAYRLEATGIYLFQENTMGMTLWSIVRLILKFVVMALTAFSSSLNPKITYALPVLYIATSFSLVIFRPYLMSFNNLLEAFLFILNFGFSLIPICASYGYDVPTVAVVPIAVLFILIPITMFIGSFCPNKKQKLLLSEDPTYRKKSTSKRVEDEASAENANENEKIIEIKKSLMLSIHQTMNPPSVVEVPEKIDDEVPEKMDGDEDFILPNNNDDIIIVEDRENIIKIFNEMYYIVDLIIDGSTCNFLMNCLKLLNVCGFFAAGWYMAGIRSTPLPTQYKC